MTTRILPVNATSPEPENIREAAEILTAGGLVAFPTETVYGLGADALLPEAATAIYAAKGRPSDNPLIIHIAEFSALDRIVREIPPQARALAEAFWPGPLTMVFNKSAAVPLATTGGLDTVAVRMPSHPVALALIREAGGYIAAPSANTSGRPSPTLAAHVAEDLSGRIPLILDGGPVGIGIESTIIDLSTLQEAEGDTLSVPMILRPGYITREMLTQVIGTVCDDPGFSGKDPQTRPKAPGMKYRHYAPKAQLTLVDGEATAVISRINALTAQSCADGKRVGVICTTETAPAYDAHVVRVLGSRSDEAAITQQLYALLRDFDALDVDLIYAETFFELRLGSAIMNRLLKAAGYRVISTKKE